MKEQLVFERLTAAGQLSLDRIPHLAAAGFGGIINLRPDNEEDGQPSHRDAARIAHKAGMEYAYIPVDIDTLTEADLFAFKAAMSAVKGPIYAHCGSGKRALLLHAIAEVSEGRMEAGDIPAFGRQFDVDLSGATTWIEREHRRTPRVKGFYNDPTGSIQYVVVDPATRHCAIIDPVHDFDEKSGATSTRSADEILAFVARENLTVEWVLDTHPHADHFSAAQYIKAKTGAPTAIGSKIKEVQSIWKAIYNWPDFPADGSQWDRLFSDGDRFTIGQLDAKVLLCPGHTLASMTYLVGDAAFIHDTAFMPDTGTARADFPGGSARSLWQSIQKIMALPDETRLFTGHDYKTNGRHPRWESTVGDQKRRNRHIAGITEDEFVALREERDRELPMPKLILHALQVNMCGGGLPEPEANGKRYLKIPLDALEK